MCWGRASNVHIPELGHQRCVPLGISTVTFVLLVFLSCSVFRPLEQIFRVPLGALVDHSTVCFTDLEPCPRRVLSLTL